MPRCSLKTRYFPATFAWALLLGTTSLFFYYPCWYYVQYHPWVVPYQSVITFFVLANFTLATFMDPGVIPKAPPDEDREDDFRAPLYKSVEINGITVRMKWCVTCKFYRPPRCSHCSVCNHCIETFDHHCPWVNNCIGRRNYRFFFFFLISLSGHMLSIFGLSMYYVMYNKDRITSVEPIVSMVIMGVIALLAIPIFGLTGFHMVLVSRGRTTNEQVTGKFTGGFNPFSRGCWYNCCYAQFGPQYPSLVRPSKYIYKSSKKRRGEPAPAARSASAISTIATGTHQQVKTYAADNGSAHRPRAQHALYNKLSPQQCRDASDEGSLEGPGASQSADCEPTPPPLQRRGSKANLFPPEYLAPPHHPHQYPRLAPHTRNSTGLAGGAGRVAVGRLRAHAAAAAAPRLQGEPVPAGVPRASAPPAPVPAPRAPQQEQPRLPRGDGAAEVRHECQRRRGPRHCGPALAHHAAAHQGARGAHTARRQQSRAEMDLTDNAIVASTVQPGHAHAAAPARLHLGGGGGGCGRRGGGGGGRAPRARLAAAPLPLGGRAAAAARASAAPRHRGRHPRARRVATAWRVPVGGDARERAARRRARVPAAGAGAGGVSAAAAPRARPAGRRAPALLRARARGAGPARGARAAAGPTRPRLRLRLQLRDIRVGGQTAVCRVKLLLGFINTPFSVVISLCARAWMCIVCIVRPACTCVCDPLHPGWPGWCSTVSPIYCKAILETLLKLQVLFQMPLGHPVLW